MATISPNGRFIAAAAFTADVKVSFNVQIYLIYFELLIHLNVRKHIDTTSTIQ